MIENKGSNTPFMIVKLVLEKGGQTASVVKDRATAGRLSCLMISSGSGSIQRHVRFDIILKPGETRKCAGRYRLNG